MHMQMKWQGRLGWGIRLMPKIWKILHFCQMPLTFFPPWKYWMSPFHSCLPWPSSICRPYTLETLSLIDSSFSQCQSINFHIRMASPVAETRLTGLFLLGGWGELPRPAENLLISHLEKYPAPPHQIFIPLHQRLIPPLHNNFDVITQ